MLKRNPKQRKVLITGGAGFIGSHLCEELLVRDFSVTAVDNLSTSSLSNISGLKKIRNFKFIKGSILNRRLMGKLVKNCDIVYHMAAAVGVRFILDHPLESLITNTKGTETILEAADKFHKKVLLASTSEVYGKHICAPFKEDDDRTLGPTSISRWSYAEAKATDEFLGLAYAKERKLPIIIIRLFNTVGPKQTGRYGMVLPQFIQQALNQKPLTVYGDGLQLRSFTYVRDAVRAIIDLSLADKAVGETVNIGTDQTISIKDLAQKVIERTHSSSQIQLVPYNVAYGDKASDFQDMQCRIPDITKIKTLISYKPEYNIDAIIDLTTAYFRKKVNYHRLCRWLLISKISFVCLAYHRQIVL